jgi:transposase
MRASGVLARLFEALAHERDAEGYLIDATIIRAHQDASGAAKEGAQEIGRSRGGPSTKIHAVVDALGNPVRLALSPGQAHEMKLAYELLLGDIDITDAYVAGDKAYDAAPLVHMLETESTAARWSSLPRPIAPDSVRSTCTSTTCTSTRSGIWSGRNVRKHPPARPELREEPIDCQPRTSQSGLVVDKLVVEVDCGSSR